MLIEYRVEQFQTKEFVYQEFTKVNEEDYMDKNLDTLELMKRALKTTINAVKNKSEYNGKDFCVKVRDIVSGNEISSFNFMQVYSEDNKNG